MFEIESYLTVMLILLRFVGLELDHMMMVLLMQDHLLSQDTIIQSHLYSQQSLTQSFHSKKQCRPSPKRKQNKNESIELMM